MAGEEDALYRELGQRLRSVRKERSLTQDQVATAISMERTSISNVESGRQRLPLHTLYQYCSVLGVDVAHVLPDPLTSRSTKQVPFQLGAKSVMVPTSVNQVITKRFGGGKP